MKNVCRWILMLSLVVLMGCGEAVKPNPGVPAPPSGGTAPIMGPDGKPMKGTGEAMPGSPPATPPESK